MVADSAKGIPPTRLVRYCCAILKETGGKNRALVTGVRRAESTKRQSKGVIETYTPNPSDRIILNNDNDDKRQIVEHCQLQGKIIFNPICDWSDNDVKEYINQEILFLIRYTIVDLIVLDASAVRWQVKEEICGICTISQVPKFVYKSIQQDA